MNESTRRKLKQTFEEYGTNHISEDYDPWPLVLNRIQAAKKTNSVLNPLTQTNPTQKSGRTSMPGGRSQLAGLGIISLLLLVGFTSLIFLIFSISTNLSQTSQVPATASAIPVATTRSTILVPQISGVQEIELAPELTGKLINDPQLYLDRSQLKIFISTNEINQVVGNTHSAFIKAGYNYDDANGNHPNYPQVGQDSAVGFYLKNDQNRLYVRLVTIPEDPLQLFQVPSQLTSIQKQSINSVLKGQRTLLIVAGLSLKG